MAHHASREALVDAQGLGFWQWLFENIEDAYCFLMKNYEPGDKVFLFEFRRGAYTARVLAGMLHAVGLLWPGTENLVRYGMDYWRKHRGSDSPGGRLCAEFKATLARECPVHFVGVWDTVGSFGFFNHFRTFPFTYRNPEIAHMRHPVSIDERRCCFCQNLFGMSDHNSNQDVKNVWFAGVHSDVGGGYSRETAGLAKLAFAWIMREAARCGVRGASFAY